MHCVLVLGLVAVGGWAHAQGPKLKRAIEAVNNDHLLRAARLRAKLDRRRPRMDEFERLQLDYVTLMFAAGTQGRQIDQQDTISLKSTIEECSGLLRRQESMDSNPHNQLGATALDRTSALRQRATAQMDLHKSRLPRVQELADSVLQNIGDGLEAIIAQELDKVGDKAGSAEYMIKFMRDGKDLMARLSLFYKKDMYGYNKGEYKSPAVDYPIRLFSLLIKEQMFRSTAVTTRVTGEADAHTPGDGLKYGGEFWELVFDGKVVKKGDRIDNRMLAYLRGRNAQEIFELITVSRVISINAVDHLQDPKRPKGEDYRKIEVVCALINYFEGLPSADDLEHLPSKFIVIKNNEIIVR